MKEKSKKSERPVIGVPFFMTQNPYQAGTIPPTAIFGDPMDAPIQETIYRDTPAPFHCPFCGNTGLTDIRAKPSLAALFGCMMPFCLGICFLCPATDCLWHKHHYCPLCKEEVARFDKTDHCLIVDPPNWAQPSYALPPL